MMSMCTVFYMYSYKLSHLWCCSWWVDTHTRFTTTMNLGYHNSVLFALIPYSPLCSPVLYTVCEWSHVLPKHAYSTVQYKYKYYRSCNSVKLVHFKESHTTRYKKPNNSIHYQTQPLYIKTETSVIINCGMSREVSQIPTKENMDTALYNTTYTR